MRPRATSWRSPKLPLCSFEGESSSGGAVSLDDPRVQAVQGWVQEVVVGLNLCPFAAGPLGRGKVGWRSVEVASDAVMGVLALVEEVDSGAYETALLVLPDCRFSEFSDIAAAAQDMLEQTRLDQRFQLASFHPDYCFEGAWKDDPANATNQSPYPALHVLRVEDVSRAVDSHPNIAGVPERNMALLRDRAGWTE